MPAVSQRSSSNQQLDVFQALANEHRLRILNWLADPARHFRPQQVADLVEDGVCVAFLTEKSGLSQPTVTRHMQILTRCGLVSSKRVKNWVFYKLAYAGSAPLNDFLDQFQARLCSSADTGSEAAS